MTRYMVRYWRNLKITEFSVLASSRYEARLFAINLIGIHPDSIIQIKEATD